MDIRNPQYNAFGTIDCEVNHPTLGWIPFTATSEDYPEIFQAAEKMQPAPYVPTPVAKEQQQANRAKAYKNEADPLFFKYQRGEATEAEWLDKIEEIRARYP